MISDPTQLARQLGFNPVFVALLVSAVFTTAVLVAQSVAAWFGDRDS